MNFESARIVVLYVIAHELLEEYAEIVDEKGFALNREDFIATVYELAVPGRDMMHFVLNYTEEEVVHACNNLWDTFVRGDVISLKGF